MGNLQVVVDNRREEAAAERFQVEEVVPHCSFAAFVVSLAERPGSVGHSRIQGSHSCNFAAHQAEVEEAAAMVQPLQEDRHIHSCHRHGLPKEPSQMLHNYHLPYPHETVAKGLLPR